VEVRRQTRIRSLRGKVRWSGDLAEMRTGRAPKR
jgi:hypothetical protein